MKKKIAFLLAIVMAMSLMLVGCSANIKGTWVAEVDFTDIITDNMAQSMPAMAEYFSFSNLTMDMVIEIEDEENYTISIDKGSVEEFVDKVVDQYIAGVEKQLGRTLSEAERKVYDKQMRASAGDFENFAMSGSGTYTFEDDELVLDKENGGTLTFEYYKGELTYVETSDEADPRLESALKKATFEKE